MGVFSAVFEREEVEDALAPSWNVGEVVACYCGWFPVFDDVEVIFGQVSVLHEAVDASVADLFFESDSGFVCSVWGGGESEDILWFDGGVDIGH